MAPCENRKKYIQLPAPHLDLEALLDDLADRVATKIAERIPATSATRQRLLTVAQAAAYLGRSKVAIHHMTSHGVLPVVRHDRRVFIDIQDLDRWIDQGKERMR